MKTNCMSVVGKYIFLAWIAATSLSLLQAQKIEEPTKLLPDDGASEDFFGSAVAIDDDVAVVGAWLKGDLVGAAYVFRFDGNNWVQEQKLLGDDTSDGDFFGHAVDVYQDYIVVGASGAENTGAAYVFHYNGTEWVQIARLTAAGALSFDRFGCSVSMDDEYIVIGADRAQYSLGAVSIFKKEGNNWVQQQKLLGPMYASAFGGAVDKKDDAILIGAPDNSFAFVFMLDGNSWEKVAELMDIDGSIHDKFGETVSIEADIAVVGATHHQNANGASGAVYVYKKQGSNWVEKQKIVADDGEFEDHFGCVSLYGSKLIVGACHDDDYGMNAGAVYIFERADDSFDLEDKIFAYDGFAGDEFGSSVAVSDEFFIVGSPNDNDNGSSSGSGYVFSYDFQSDVTFSNTSPHIVLEQNHPNPFHSSTIINISVPAASNIRLDVFSTDGRLIRTLYDGPVEAGEHQFQWDGDQQQEQQVPPGFYFYRLQTPRDSHCRKMLKADL